MTVPLRLRFSRAVQTIVAYLFYGLCWLLPLGAASGMGGWLLRRIGPHTRMNRTAAANLARALPEKTDAERAAILTGMWDNIGRVAAEYAHLHRMGKNIEIVGGEHIETARAAGKGVIFFGGHLGNWELGPVCGRRLGLPLHVVYRRPNNPGVDGLLRHARGAGADGHVPKGREGALAMLRLLKSGAAIGMLADQKLNEGLAIPFFGRPAMTAPAMAEFAYRYGTLLYPIRIERLGGTRYRCTIHPHLPVNREAERKGEVARLLTEVNRQMEGWIRERPEQWLWVHRRWPEST